MNNTATQQRRAIVDATTLRQALVPIKKARVGHQRPTLTLKIEDGRLYLQTMARTICVTQSMPIDVSYHWGQVTVYLRDFVKALVGRKGFFPLEDLLLTSVENHPGFRGTDYDGISDAHYIMGSDLIPACRAMIATEDTVRSYGGVVCFDNVQGKTRLVSTDGFRLHYSDSAGTLPEAFSKLCIGARTIKTIATLGTGRAFRLHVSDCRSMLRVVSEKDTLRTEIIARPSGVQFPNYVGVMPKTDHCLQSLHTETIRMRIKELLAQSDKSRAIHLSEISDRFPPVAVNGQFFLEALAGVTADFDLAWGAKEESPIEIRTATHTAVIVPIVRRS